MTLSEHAFLYCERGNDAGLYAEPLNAASNAGFLLAALIAFVLLLRRPAETRSADHYLLIVLVLAIGLGSLAFHLYATRLAELGDTVPIGVFMLVYLGFALNRLLRVPPGWTVLLLIGFTALTYLSTQLQCSDAGVTLSPSAGIGVAPCLNGSVGYLPALVAMLIVGAMLKERHHRAAGYVLWATAIFALSIALRSVDLTLCDTLQWQGRKIGTHAGWHLLNALVLFLLLLASLKAEPDEMRNVVEPRDGEGEPEDVRVVPEEGTVEEPHVPSSGELAESEAHPS